MTTTLSEALLAKYPKNGKIAEKWTIATGTTFAWESLTKANMSRFAEFLEIHGGGIIKTETADKHPPQLIKPCIHPLSERP